MNNIRQNLNFVKRNLDYAFLSANVPAGRVLCFSANNFLRFFLNSFLLSKFFNSASLTLSILSLTSFKVTSSNRYLNMNFKIYLVGIMWFRLICLTNTFKVVLFLIYLNIHFFLNIFYTLLIH